MAESPETSPAGPDRLRRFDALGALVFSGVLVVVAATLLVDALVQGRNPALAIVLVGLGAAGSVFGVVMVRRHRVRADGTTLDEADPRRTLEQQERRDRRVRAQNAELTPRQEVVTGGGMIVLAGVVFVGRALMGIEPEGADLLLSIALTVIGVGLLVHSAITRLRRRG